MSQYDLANFQRLPWVRVMRWTRAGFAIFAVVGLAAVAYGFYRQVGTSGTSPTQDVGAGLLFGILALFLIVAVLMRPQADALIIDEVGVRLGFKGGGTYFRPWDRSGLGFKGRRTPGARDSVSGGRALWSIYGKFGGLSETFIPELAFSELVTASKIHGLSLIERGGRPGWTLYTLTRD